MDASGSVLKSIFADDGNYEEDIEMLDAESDDAVAGGSDEGNEPPGRPPEPDADREVSAAGSKQRKATSKKRRNRNKRRRSGGVPTAIGDINRFVNDTCRHLKEKKSYLIWNAVGCLGVSAVNDLVKEVDAIQKCGGQLTADGKRFRNGGGVLWNILKTREPKAYKEIMAKGRELEKQFRHPKPKPATGRKDVPISDGTVPDEEVGELSIPEQLDTPQQGRSSDRKSVLERIRVPVSYDDLFEEGEICENT